ncbi:Methyltransferase type 11 [Chthoniobacter flavus Ellin428]|uniref:Methyltransferase type 11 n=1 Tax=Chthoniobacter flavus Ellin428 TaxID=497964 RepID=B4DAA3_9BACT|nr:methyltransferase domain-containing protein [Chthoniobacter flavus]EDY16564.1 Methyltransferase type 11 [Chthoniobacter flavus Ellin428]TCO92013.1 methyltransferase family protein [Chthoniobacter flavus]
MCTSKSCSRAEFAKSKSIHRILLALLLILLGVGVSLHLRASHFAHWWVPAAVLLVLGHGVILGAVAWMVSRLRPLHPESAAQTRKHPHAHPHPSEHSKVLHRPRLYDWLMRAHTFGNERRFRTSILQIAELQPGETVLDVGCGTGSLLIEAARQMGSGSLLHGVEPSSEMLAHARHKAKELISETQFVQGSADQIPFPGRSFDVVFCTMVLHHLPASVQTGAIKEMCRVVRPNGRIVIIDMQPPRTVAAKLSIVTLFHKFGTDATAPDWQNIERVLQQRNFQSAILLPIWNGAVGAMVARMQTSESRP